MRSAMRSVDEPRSAFSTKLQHSSAGNTHCYSRTLSLLHIILMRCYDSVEVGTGPHCRSKLAPTRSQHLKHDVILKVSDKIGHFSAHSIGTRKFWGDGSFFADVRKRHQISPALSQRVFYPPEFPQKVKHFLIPAMQVTCGAQVMCSALL